MASSLAGSVLGHHSVYTMCLYVCVYIGWFLCMFVLVCSGEVNGHSVSRILSWPPWLLGPDPFLAAISNLASPIANMVRACDACCPPEDQEEENDNLIPP